MRDERKTWFKCFPTKWLGAIYGMEAHVSLIYLTVCLRIYEVDGPCKDDTQVLVRRTGLSKKKVDQALDYLLKKKKLTQTPDGFMNPFAAEILALRDDHVKQLSNSQSGRAKKRWEKEQSNQTSFNADLELDIEVRKESKEDSRATRGNVTWPTDYREQFWAKYPRKVGKAAAMKALDRVYKSGAVDWDRLWCALVKFAAWALSKDIQYVKHPSTWINAGCWDDELTTGEFKNGRTGQVRANPAAGSAATNSDRIRSGVARVAEKRGLIERTADRGSDRFSGSDDAAGSVDADAGSAPNDCRPLRQIESSHRTDAKK